MKDKNEKKKKKSLLYRFFARIINCFYGKKKFVGLENLPSEPAIIISNHAQMHGPLSAELQFPYKKSIWCIGHLMHLKEAPKYAFEDFWSRKPKWTHWFYKMLSYLIAPLCVWIFKNADVIGVYKDQRGISTFKKSIKALKQGDYIIINPECHVEYNEIVNEFQDKFIDLAKLYFKDTGKEICFVPMYNAPTLKTIVCGKPIKFDSSAPIKEQRKVICDYLKTEITKLAKDLPVHSVVPYANVPKKQYPKSK